MARYFLWGTHCVWVWRLGRWERYAIPRSTLPVLLRFIATDFGQALLGAEFALRVHACTCKFNNAPHCLTKVGGKHFCVCVLNLRSRGEEPDPDDWDDIVVEGEIVVDSHYEPESEPDQRQ